MPSPISEIERAFDGVAIPQELTLHVAEAHDNYDYDHDSEHRAKDYVGRWQDVPEEHLEHCAMGLTHLAADGVRFYLPAAMLWVIKNFRDSDSMLVDWTIYQLAPNRNDPNLSQRFDKRFGLFNPVQRCACRSFLKFLLEQDSDGDYIDAASAADSLSIEWKNKQDKQDDASQPATAPDSKAEGKEKPTPESEGRSQ